jgi:hypothetical protein
LQKAAIYCNFGAKKPVGNNKKMLGKLQDKNQRELFRPMLSDFINPHH